jgi:DNA-binding response OmpR family regulator
MNKRVLIVEDDKSIARLLRDNLEFEGFIVDWSETGRDALQRARQFSPDLILLDLMLPNNVDGLELCRGFANSRERIPVIILTARGEKEDRVLGLSLGADDYIVKPFALEELLARVNAVLRRTKGRIRELKLGAVTIDFVNLRATKAKRQIMLTDLEFEILRYFGERPGTIVSRDELLQLVWGYNEAPLTRTVDSFIFRLRQKIEVDPRHPKYIKTVYGDGYRLSGPVTTE